MSCKVNATQWVLDSVSPALTFVIDGDREYTVGRARNNSIILMSLFVSRNHCILHCHEGCLKVKDLGSANGTFLNGTLITANVETRVEAYNTIGFGVKETCKDGYVFTVKPVNRGESNVKQEIKEEPRDDVHRTVAQTVNVPKIKKEVCEKGRGCTDSSVCVIVLDDSDNELSIQEDPIVDKDSTVIKRDKDASSQQLNVHMQINYPSSPIASSSSSSCNQTELHLPTFPGPLSSLTGLNQNCWKINGKIGPRPPPELSKVLEKLQDTIVGSEPKGQHASSTVQPSVPFCEKIDHLSRKSSDARPEVGGRFTQVSENIVSSTSESNNLLESLGDTISNTEEIHYNTLKSDSQKLPLRKSSLHEPHSKSSKNTSSHSEATEEFWDKICNSVLGSDDSDNNSSGDVAPVRKKLVGKRKVVLSSSSNEDDGHGDSGHDVSSRRKKLRTSSVLEKTQSAKKDIKLKSQPVVVLQKVKIPSGRKSQTLERVNKATKKPATSNSIHPNSSHTSKNEKKPPEVVHMDLSKLSATEPTAKINNDKVVSNVFQLVSAPCNNVVLNAIKQEPVFSEVVPMEVSQSGSQYTSADDVICISDSDDEPVSCVEDEHHTVDEHRTKGDIDDEEIPIDRDDSDCEDEWLFKLSQGSMVESPAVEKKAVTEAKITQSLHQVDDICKNTDLYTTAEETAKLEKEFDDLRINSEDEFLRSVSFQFEDVSYPVAGPSSIHAAQEDVNNEPPFFQSTKKTDKRTESSESDDSDIFEKLARPIVKPGSTSRRSKDVKSKDQHEKAKKPTERRIILCDPLPKSRKRHTSGSRKEVTKSVSKSNDVDKTPINQYMSSAEKKQIHDERKKKLKELTEQQKKTQETGNCQKVKTKAPVKNTTLSRADKLLEHMVPSTNADRSKTEVSNKSKMTQSSSQKNEVRVRTRSDTASEKKKDADVSERESRRACNSALSERNKGTVSSERESRSGSSLKTNSNVVKPPKVSFKDLPKIPRLKNTLQSEATGQSKETSGELKSQITEGSAKKTPKVRMSSVAKENIAQNTQTHKGCLVLPERGSIKSGRKSVQFQPDESLVQTQYFEISGFSKLHPVNCKDVPVSRRPKVTSWDIPKNTLDPTLAEICSWNIKWLAEQKANSDSPPVYQPYSLYPMLTSFCNYADYFKVVHPLMLLSLWAEVVEDSERFLNDPRREVYVDSVSDGPDNLSLFRCHLLLPEDDIRRQKYPCGGDLCQIEMNVDPDSADYSNSSLVELCSQGINQRIRIFAYVESNYKESYNPTLDPKWVQVPAAQRPTCKVNLVLKVRKRTFSQQTTMKIKVLAKIKTYLRAFEAVNHLPRTTLCGHILDPKVENYSLPSVNISEPLVWKDSLNDDQKYAVLKCARVCTSRGPKICLIQGPPGTGKTKVIVNLVMQILRGALRYQTAVVPRHRQPRILLCAPSNAAVDEIVERLLEVRQALPKKDRFKMVRIGRIHAMRDAVKAISLTELCEKEIMKSRDTESLESIQLELQMLEARKTSCQMTLETAMRRNASTASCENKLKEISEKIMQLKGLNGTQRRFHRSTYQLERETERRILIGADIVATTVTSAYNMQTSEVFSKGDHKRFTCCIFDEATQCSEPVSLLPLLFGIDKFVLVGDPEQLPATVISKEANKNGLRQSLFARICSKFQTADQSPVLFLGVQYRMHPEICHWPNEYMYSGRIVSKPYLNRRSPLKPYVVVSLRFQQQGHGELVNVREAQLVTAIAEIVRQKVPKMRIAVITPYQKQRQSIMRHLERLPPDVNIEVNTVDSFQGQEVDVAILSCVRTEGIGFLSDSRRLNVAITRAKYSLIICGNFKSLQGDRMWSSLLEDARQRRVLCLMETDDVPTEILHFAFSFVISPRHVLARVADAHLSNALQPGDNTHN